MHPCFAQAIKLIAHPKLPQFFHFHGDFLQKWHFAHPKISFSHPELPFLAKSMGWGHSVGEHSYVCTSVHLSVHPFVRPNDGFRALSLKVLSKFTLNLACVFTGWVFRNGPIFGHVATYLAPWWAKMAKPEVSRHNSIQTLLVCLLDECSEMMWFSAPWANIWSHGGLKWVRSQISKHFQSILFKPCGCAHWVSVQKFVHFRPCGQSFGPLLSVRQSN